MKQVNGQSAIRNYPRDTKLGVGKADENGHARMMSSVDLEFWWSKNVNLETEINEKCIYQMEDVKDSFNPR